MSNFEKASREKYTYPIKGLCNTEDLWDCSLEELDALALKYDQELGVKQKSFIKKVSKRDAVTKAKFSIVKHIIEVKLGEVDARENDAEVKVHNQKILDAIAVSENKELRKKSPEELRKMLK